MNLKLPTIFSIIIKDAKQSFLHQWLL